MGFKMKQGPISMKGSPVYLPGIGNALKAGYNAIFGSSTNKPTNPTDPRNMTREQRNTMLRKAMRSLSDKGRQMTHETSSKGNYEVPALGSSGYGIKGSGYKDEAIGGTTTLIKPTKTKKKVVKKKVNKGTVSTSSGFSSLTKAPKVGENIVKQSSKKIDLVSSSRPQTRKEIKATKKKDKAKSGVSRQQVRLAKTKAKAASAKAKTNQTAKSIDTSKPKSADTGAKQTSARSSRAKAKRLENRASRIEGRIERKASRQAQRKKTKENR